jgi:hypothetical protein
VQAHIEQARRRLDQLAEAGARWSVLEDVVEKRAWPERLVIALEQSMFNGVDRASYMSEADVSATITSSRATRAAAGNRARAVCCSALPTAVARRRSWLSGPSIRRPG